MAPIASISLLSALVALSHAIQPSAPSPKPAPLRDLPWAQLNFLATTDTHGWLAGHLQEASFSADWGDYVSFAKHLRDKADKDGTDLLVIDSGDRVEGNGLYDASDPKGKYTHDILKQQEIDLLCIGNHELYKAATAENELLKTVPNFKGSYIASNIDIYNPERNETQPLAARFKKFTTKNQGIRIMAFGFLFNFRDNANNSIVQNVEDTMKEKWFTDAIHDREVDLIVIVGHVGFRQPESRLIYETIRKTQWDTPIAFLGGHVHIRDFKKFDDNAWGLEAGRYLETIGFMSIDGLSTGGKKPKTAKTAKFQRRYIDHNLYSMYHHTGLNATTFPTSLGKHVSQQITDARRSLKLDEVLGCAPKTLWMSRVPADDKNSIYKWLKTEVFPDVFKTSGNTTEPKLILTNTGSIRFDIFKGPFTRDSRYLVSPFTSPFKRIKNVQYTIASKLLDILNNGGVRAEYASGAELYSVGRVAQESATDKSFAQSQIVQGLDVNQQVLIGEKPDKPLLPGYTTKDDGGDDGDDTLHVPVPVFDAPGCIQVDIDIPTGKDEPETVDVIFNGFLEPRIVHVLGVDPKIVETLFNGAPMTDAISSWIQQHWKCKK